MEVNLGDEIQRNIKVKGWALKILTLNTYSFVQARGEVYQPCSNKLEF